MMHAQSRSACRAFGSSIQLAIALTVAYALLAIPVAATVQDTGVKTGNAFTRVAKRAKRVAPLPRTKGAPGPNLPDLASVHNLQPAAPQAPAPVEAGRPCHDCGARNETVEFAAARAEAGNRTGAGFDLFSRNFGWSLPVVAFDGRAGLDLNLSLVYNSLVWTRAGNRIAFDADRGQPSPGFRLGMPTIQPRYFDERMQSFAYLLIAPSGERVALRQVESNAPVYEATDGSRLQLTDHGERGATLRASDGSVMTYGWVNGQLHCTEVKDRNGNFISAEYNQHGHAARVTDTLGRVLSFNRDAGGNLLSITQEEHGAQRTLATFGYSALTIQTNFPRLEVVGPANGSTIAVLTQVGLPSGVRYRFDYTSWGQVHRVSRLAADGHTLSRTSYDLPLTAAAPLQDSPRPSERREWAEDRHERGESVTRYAFASDGEWGQATSPDGTIFKEVFATQGWQRGLTVRTETTAVGELQKWATIGWTQDDTGLAYQLNARPVETNVWDANGARRRARVEYGQYGLPTDVYVYEGDAANFTRRMHTDYNLDAEYVGRRIIGLPAAKTTFDEHNRLVAKATFEYDAPDSIIEETGTLRHDDEGFGAGLKAGRGLLTAARQWDAQAADDESRAITSQSVYNTSGSLVLLKDPLGRQTRIAYEDDFADGIERRTRALPTRVTNAAGGTSATQYDYLTGQTTRTEDTAGIVQTTAYDAAGRVLMVTNTNTGAYTRWAYHESGKLFATYRKLGTGMEELAQYSVLDGTGAVRANAVDNPSSTGGYSGSYTVFDELGRAVKRTNMAEMNSAWAAAGDDAAGWVWTTQGYDWKGRPRVTTNPDGTLREVSFDGCGCAGEETITITDEGGRSRRMSKDSSGELVKVEELNWDGSVYGTTEYSYDALGRMTRVNQSGQVRSVEYDGFGRVVAETTPEQGRTSYAYNADSTVREAVDARGVRSLFSYGSLGEITAINYRAPEGVAATSPTRFGYDEAGRRISMEDELGRVDYRYDQRGHLVEESRRFADLPDAAYTLGYEYNLAGTVTGVTSSLDGGVRYEFDRAGRLTAIRDQGRVLASNITHRAWGGLKGIRYGNGRRLNVNYDQRQRLAQWDTSGVQGNEYGYGDFDENTGRVTQAKNLYDRVLDRSYEYDHVGRLQAAYSGSSARAHVGRKGANNEAAQGELYAQQYEYDVWGNLTRRAEGEAGITTYRAAYKNNQLQPDAQTGVTAKYDQAGNLTEVAQLFRTKEGSLKQSTVEKFTYDAAGNQRVAVGAGAVVKQDYDGEGLRGRKVEGSSATYYLRSSVLGRQVMAELDGEGRLKRSYVYMGAELLAVRSGGEVAWVHTDPITKGVRMTGAEGQVVGLTEFDPWGQVTATQFDAQGSLQPGRKYATYERDANGSDDAMHRRYNPRMNRFEEPDPYRGSYDLLNPQSFNRYSYVQNDPVNYSDPSGLCTAADGDCVVTVYGSSSTGAYSYYSYPGITTYTAPSNSYGYGSSGGGSTSTTTSQYSQQRVDNIANSAVTNVNTLSQNDPARKQLIIDNKKDIQSKELTLCHAATESSFIHGATGQQGELGLFQLKLSTANEVASKNNLGGPYTSDQVRTDDALNTRLGTAHLQNLINTFGGDVRKSLGAYKQGEFGVKQNGLSVASQEYADGILQCERRLQGR